MDFVVLLQSLATNAFTIFVSILEFLGQMPFFLFVFALFFLLYDKEFGYKFFLSFTSGFVFGSLFLKNIIARPRPYQVNNSLMSMRSSYSFSLPSATSILAAQEAYFYCNFQNKKLTKNAVKATIVVATVVLLLLVGLSQIYFANNYLLDVILGLILGFVLAFFICRFVNVDTKLINLLFYVLFPIFVFMLICFLIFANNFANIAVFNFLGISTSILLGAYLENKFIKYEIKNNLIFVFFKFLIVLIILGAYYLIWKLILTDALPAYTIFGFVKFFIAGLIVTLLFPLLFKTLEKYFYVFSQKVKLEKVVNSYVSLSQKGTEKIAREIFKTLNIGDVVLLSGDLGAGKSVLVRSMLKYAGVTKSVTSPTFTLLNEYVVGRRKFYHFDMYRIEDDEEIVNIGYEEIIENKNAIKFIEWPEQIKNYIPRRYKKITIVKLGKNSRNVILEDYTK